ncbi:MAG: glycosyltransferase family 4 protein [Acidobacteriales bacterium]|nr:glycosyltransferase family 4 protein [Terriglobales bacterium]
MRKSKVIILTPSLTPFDAVGNDVRGMAAVLRNGGYEVEIVADEIDRIYAGVGRLLDPGDSRHWNDSGATLIYHHAVAWPKGERLLEASQVRVVVRYHNITPARFFSRYSEGHYRACKEGEASTRRLARLPRAWFLGDSVFNCDELIRLGAPAARTAALAPIHATEELSRVPFDAPTLDRYKDGSANILFVGGLKPNKGYVRALRVLAEYRRWSNAPARFIFAGKVDPHLSNYREALEHETGKLGLAGHVVFTGAVTPSQLRSLYMLADAFLSVSEHEGFCVPLVEAMYFRLPIVAWGTTAVGETVGEAGLVWDHFDAGCLAESIHSVIEDGRLARHLAAAGFQRYQANFRPGILSARLNSLLGRVARGEALR